MKNQMSLLFTMLSVLFSAEVTFNVDMSQEDVGDEYPTLWMGAYYPEPGIAMEDIDGDGIWSVTLDLSAGSYTYKFRNGAWTDWNTGSGWENIMGQDCAVGNYHDREVVVSTQDINIPTVCFSSCTSECVEPPSQYDVTFRVDMNDVDNFDPSDGVYLQGTLNGWCGVCNPMSDADEDYIYELTIPLAPGEYEYLFTTNGWNGLVGNATIGVVGCDYNPSDEFANYGFILEDSNLVLDIMPFGGCPLGDPSTVTFDIDGVDDCGFVSVTGTFDEWSGWGANQDNGMSIQVTAGPHEFVILCVDTSNPTWYNDIWGSSTQYGAPLGSACDFDPSDEFPNYGFTIGSDESLTVSYCAGSCSTDCSESSCGDGLCNGDEDASNCPEDCNLTFCGDDICNGSETSETCPSDCSSDLYTVTFDIDGVDDCDFVSVTGSFSNWDGWGATTDTNLQIELSQGSYEFIVLCVDTSNATWYNDIWGNSEILGAPLGSECDFNPSDEFANYGFTLDSSDLTISYCAGSCDDECGSSSTLHTVNAGNYYYSPSSLTINAGDSVEFINDGGFHDVVVTSGPELLELPSCGAPCNMGTLTFNIPGTYEYICSIGSHAALGMVGTIIVEDNSVGESYDVTFDVAGIDGCGQVNVTGSFDSWSGWGANPNDGYTVSLETGDYEFLYLCVDTSNDGWWNDVWSNSTQVTAPLGSECDFNPSDEYPNYGFSVVDSDLTILYDDCSSQVCGTGDVTYDGALNVLDIVTMVNFILGSQTPTDDQLCFADMNGDGGLNVLDIVAAVSTIVNPRLIDSATSIQFDKTNSGVSYKSDGYVGAIQMTIYHDESFTFNLTDKALVANSITEDNFTTLIVVNPQGDDLFNSKGYFTVESVIAASSNGFIETSINNPEQYTISNAYPNPFNPSTNIEVQISSNSEVSINIFNIKGELVRSLTSGQLSAGNHSFVWDASNQPSGVYLVNSMIGSVSKIQKVMLLK